MRESNGACGVNFGTGPISPFLSSIMKKILSSFLCAVVFLNGLAAKDVLDHVNVFVGTGYHGHTFPSATVPYGSVAPGPDTSIRGWHAAAGYHWDKPTILGFSQTHLSGTGLIEWGDFMIMPRSGPVRYKPGPEDKPEVGYRSRFSHDDESASPGYYQVRLLDYDINVELTATERVAFHKYTFPEGKDRHVIMDFMHHIGTPIDVKHAYVRVHDEYTVTGYRITESRWASSRFMHFALKFSEPIAEHILRNEGRDLLYPNMPDLAAQHMQAVFKFSDATDEPLKAKISVSAVSMRNALENLETEIPHWDFDKVHDSARGKWREQLSKVDAKGNEEDLTTFYSALYRTMIHPDVHQDVNGEYRGIDKEIHKADGFTNYTVFSLWDTFRAAHPLATILHPERTGEFVKSMMAHQS